MSTRAFRKLHGSDNNKLNDLSNAIAHGSSDEASDNEATQMSGRPTNPFSLVKQHPANCNYRKNAVLFLKN